jgi:hypothetical protein
MNVSAVSPAVIEYYCFRLFSCIIIGNCTWWTECRTIWWSITFPWRIGNCLAACSTAAHTAQTRCVYIGYLRKHSSIEHYPWGALRYKPEGCGFDFRWCHRQFSLIYSLRSHYGILFDSASVGIVGENSAGGHGCLFLVSVVLLHRGLCVRLSTRTEECYRVRSVRVWSWSTDHGEAQAH